VLAIILAQGACSLVSISAYDSSADKAITKLHKQTAEFLPSPPRLMSLDAAIPIIYPSIKIPKFL